MTHLEVLWPCVLVWLAAADIMRKRLAISVKDGLTAGLGAQHCSISVLHSGSQLLGMVGLNVLFTIPPVRETQISDRFCTKILFE